MWNGKRSKTHLEDEEEHLQILLLLLRHALLLMSIGLHPVLYHGTHLMQERIGVAEFPFK